MPEPKHIIRLIAEALGYYACEVPVVGGYRISFPLEQGRYYVPKGIEGHTYGYTEQQFVGTEFADDEDGAWTVAIPELKKALAAHCEEDKEAGLVAIEIIFEDDEPVEPTGEYKTGDKVWWEYLGGDFGDKTEYAAAVVIEDRGSSAKIRLYSKRGGTTLDKIVSAESLSKRTLSNTLVDGENG